MNGCAENLHWSFCQIDHDPNYYRSGGKEKLDDTDTGNGGQVVMNILQSIVTLHFRLIDHDLN